MLLILYSSVDLSDSAAFLPIPGETYDVVTFFR
jgi:hypothetical protein